MNFKKAIGVSLLSASLLGGAVYFPLNGTTSFAAESVQETPPATVNINVHKLMYDKSFQFDVATNGIVNNGHEQQLPDGISAYNKAKYGDIEFTIYDVTSKFDGSFTDEKINEIVADVEANGAESTYITGITGKKAAVDETGNIMFKDMPAYSKGNRYAYLVVETKSPKGFTSQQAKPAVVVTPMTTSDGKNFFKDINLYPKNIMQDLEFTLTKEAEDGSVLAGAKFDLYRGKPGEGEKLTETPVEADAKGIVKATGLQVGAYYWVEVPSDNVVGDTTTDGNSEVGKYLLGSDAKNDTNNKLTFEITPDGIDADSLAGTYVNYLPPTGEKEVTNDKDGYSVGDEAHYKATVHIPEDVNGSTGIEMVGDQKTTSSYTVLNWKDIPQEGLKYIPSKADIVVKDSEGNTLEANKDYVITNAKDGDLEGFLIDFILNGKPTDKIATLHGQNLTVEYDMTITQDAVVQSEIDNSFSLSYKNGESGETKVITGQVPVYTYGAKFLKESSGVFGSGVAEEPLTGAEFVLKNNENQFYAGKTDEDSDGVTEVKWTEKQEEAELLVSDSKGLFEISGMKMGDYQLIEVTAPEGYQKLSEPVNFTIDEDSYNDDQTVKIENDAKSVIPRTGSKEMIFTLSIGLGTLTVAAAAIAIKHRRNA